MRAIVRRSATKADTVLVCLPGLKDRARVFIDRGFVDAVTRRRLPVDLVLADAHLGYYEEGSLLRRLHDDVIAPLVGRYARIILVGVSMGGYGAIRYAMTYPKGIEGLVLFSPFLGAGPFLRQIAEPGDEDFAQTWAWLEHGERPRIILAYGQEDAFSLTNHRLRDLLPAEDVVTGTGAHLWISWKPLWERILDRGMLPAVPAPR